MRHYRLLFPVALLALALPAVTGCGSKKASDASSGISADEPSDTIVTEQVAWSDSAVTDSGSVVTCVINMAFPVNGPAAAVDSIRAWIGRRLSSNGIGAVEQPYARAAANTSDGKTLARSVGTTAVAMGLQEVRGLESEWSDMRIGYDYRWDIKMSYQTERYSTFSANSYVYLAGAHGSTFFTGQTFGADGTLLDWENTIIPSQRADLIELAKKALMKQYFEVETYDDFRNALLINPDTLPLPVAPPYFMADGLHMVYQQYEIASYADGLPGCVIPYESVAPMLTGQAAVLAGVDNFPEIIIQEDPRDTHR